MGTARSPSQERPPPGELPLGFFACPNPDCEAFNRFGGDHLSVAEHMGKDKTIRRLYCRCCKTRFSERQGSLLEYSKLPLPAVVRIVKCLGHGCSVEATADICEVDARTVQRIVDRGEREPRTSTGCPWNGCKSRWKRSRWMNCTVAWPRRTAKKGGAFGASRPGSHVGSCRPGSEEPLCDRSAGGVSHAGHDGGIGHVGGGVLSEGSEVSAIVGRRLRALSHGHPSDLRADQTSSASSPTWPQMPSVLETTAGPVGGHRPEGSGRVRAPGEGQPPGVCRDGPADRDSDSRDGHRYADPYLVHREAQRYASGSAIASDASDPEWLSPQRFVAEESAPLARPLQLGSRSRFSGRSHSGDGPGLGRPCVECCGVRLSPGPRQRPPA